jgi:hypothetical protein
LYLRPNLRAWGLRGLYCQQVCDLADNLRDLLGLYELLADTLGCCEPSQVPLQQQCSVLLQLLLLSFFLLNSHFLEHFMLIFELSVALVLLCLAVVEKHFF